MGRSFNIIIVLKHDYDIGIMLVRIFTGILLVFLGFTSIILGGPLLFFTILLIALVCAQGLVNSYLISFLFRLEKRYSILVAFIHFLEKESRNAETN